MSDATEIDPGMTDEPRYRHGNATWRVVARPVRDGVEYVLAERDTVPAWCHARAEWPADLWDRQAREVHDAA